MKKLLELALVVPLLFLVIKEPAVKEPTRQYDLSGPQPRATDEITDVKK